MSVGFPPSLQFLKHYRYIVKKLGLMWTHKVDTLLWKSLKRYKSFPKGQGNLETTLPNKEN